MLNKYVEKIATEVKIGKSVQRMTTDDWDRFESAYSFRCPHPYFELLSTVGCGLWGGIIGVENPCFALGARYQGLIEMFKADFTCFNFGASDGNLFPWGMTDFRVGLFWKIEHNRDNWETIVLEPGFEPEITGLSVPELIWKLRTGEYESELIPTNLQSDFTLV